MNPPLVALALLAASPFTHRREVTRTWVTIALAGPVATGLGAPTTVTRTAPE